MRILRTGLAILILPVLAIGGVVLRSQEPVIAGIEPPPVSAFAPALVEKGARLAALGNCDTCHTVPGGPAYAGGRAIPTPFGTIYSTNITPAPGNGIGHWSEDAFRRAMRQGVSRSGHHLYPAFPYDHFARLDVDDIHALYAFIMTRSPADTFPPANTVPFPLSERWLLPVWNLVYLDRAPFRPDPTQSAQWNRGAYLVAGAGHCGDCHTPRNLFGGEKTSQALAGGEAEGWRAPALNAASPAPVPWDEPHLFAYLRHGSDAEHGAAAGPMQSVVGGLARADKADVQAIAAYLATQEGEISPDRRQRAAKALARAAESAEPPKPAPASADEFAATIFAGACASCHTGASAMVPPRGINLALSTVINEADPRDAIRVLLDGIKPGDGRAGPWMPGFDGAFSDPQLAALLGYLRAHYGNGPAWPDLETELHNIRGERQQ
jgi:mono/diheme cytochrome c family protein